MSARSSSQKDSFVRDRLPRQDLLPQIIPIKDRLHTSQLNVVDFLLEKNLVGKRAEAIAVYGFEAGIERSWTYRQLNRKVCKIANLMTDQFGIKPGNRVLIFAPNSPEIAAIWLAVQKIGAVGVTTLALLRVGELAKLIDKSKPALAFCGVEGQDALANAIKLSKTDCRLLSFGCDNGALYDLMDKTPSVCKTYPTQPDDVSIIAFTSGTTGDPKATVHFHADIMAICQTVGRHIVAPTKDDVFISTSPLAFTFGLGGLLIFPFFAGAASVLIDRYSPQSFVAAIEQFSASVCFTVPTFYRRLANTKGAEVLKSLRLAVSSGEALPLAVREQLQTNLALNLSQVIGATEMLHAFAGGKCADNRPGFIGPAISGYELAILDDQGKQLPAGEVGKLAVKGPTGCRYLDDARQSEYVQHGWNITGDACHMDEDGNIAFHTRHDDMIISAGYNISGPEVENALLGHPLVEECAVIGTPDAERGQIVEAHIVLKAGAGGNAATVGQLQDYVKSAIAPHKYPRSVVFADQLPKTATGKIQRHLLRENR